ncbi:DUF6124 family protein, partial [Pseudomonas helleri]
MQRLAPQQLRKRTCRCAPATAYASADNLQGLNRDVALAVVHLIAQVKASV